MSAALDEFSSYKYEEASLNNILKSADMSKGSFYHFFGDKFGLLLSLIDVAVAKKIAFFTPLLKNNKQDDFFSMIRSISRDTIQFMNYDNRLYNFSNRLLESGKELITRTMEYFPYDFNNNFGALIKNAIDKGQIDSKYSVEFISNILEVIFKNINKFNLINNSDDAYPAIDMILDVLENGIKAR